MREQSIPKRTWLIFGSAAAGSTSLYAAFTVAPLVATAMTGSRAWSGVPGAASVAGTAAGAALLSSIMSRHGRMTGLRIGYAIGLAGAVATVLSARGSQFAPLVAAMFVVGFGHASNQLCRYTAAELHPPERRPSIIGWIVWAGTVGAILGPMLPRAFRSTASWFGISTDAAGFVVAVAFYAVAAATAALTRAKPPQAGPHAARLGSIISAPRVKAALMVLLIAQATMVLVMTMTPLHVREHGHGLVAVGSVMSAHFVGMFVLAPVAGRFVARFGGVRVMLTGLVTLIAGAIASGLAPGESSVLVSAGLFVLGIGWSLAFVAASAALTYGMPYQERIKIQGAVDTLAWTVSAVASGFSGLLLAAAGFTTLALIAAAITAIPIVVLLSWRSALAPSEA